ncbi:hypothetical protein ACVIGB_004470 [Bradyrhizobium sp. USDA 4341]
MTRQERSGPNGAHSGQKQERRDPNVSRRTLVQGLAVGAAAAAAGVSSALAQNAPAPVGPPTTITSPPRDFSPRGAPTTYFWDPDIIAVDPSFDDLAQPNTSIKRLHTGLLWAGGPGLELAGPLSPVERHPEQPADALVGG